MPTPDAGRRPDAVGPRDGDEEAEGAPYRPWAGIRVSHKRQDKLDAAVLLHREMWQNIAYYDRVHPAGRLTSHHRNWSIHRHVIHTTRGLLFFLHHRALRPGRRLIGPACPDLRRRGGGGVCPRGADCPYLHIPPELTPRRGPPEDDPAYAYVVVWPDRQGEGCPWSIAPHPTPLWPSAADRAHRSV